MRIRLTIAGSLLVAGCTLAPQETRPGTPAATPQVEIRQNSELIGMSLTDLGRRFGQPRIRVQEGRGTKLQWSGGGCVLDAFLYPPASGQGLERVTHVDVRRPSGADIDLPTCLSLLARAN